MKIVQIVIDPQLGLVGLGDDGGLYQFNKSINDWELIR